ncbi:MAG: hypothetical protein AB1750_18870, partial [Chloroflexota bacterium]
MSTEIQGNQRQVRQSAAQTYTWLWLSPVLTIPTLFFVVNVDPGYALVCRSGFGNCDYDLASLITNLLAILVSGLWHLILLLQLQGAKHEFVRWHAKQALMLAGIRTTIPILLVILGGGDLYEIGLLGILILFLVYLFGNNWGRNQAKRGDCWLMRRYGLEADLPLMSQAPEAPPNEIATYARSAEPETTGNPSAPQEQKKILNRLLADLQSADASRARAAIAELETLRFSSEAVLRQLERLALGEDAELRAAALRAFDLPASRFVASRVSAHVKFSRQLFLDEIEIWVKNGLLDSARAEVIRRRYDFDIREVEPASAPAPVATPAPAPA